VTVNRQTKLGMMTSILFIVSLLSLPHGRGAFCLAVGGNNNFQINNKNAATIGTGYSSLPNLKKKNELFPLSAVKIVDANDNGESDESSNSVSPSDKSKDENTSEDDDIPGLWPCGDDLDKRMIKFALPCVANFAINPLVGAVDLFWINRMKNPLAVAGQAASNQVFSSLFWLSSFLPSVTATLVAKKKAENDEDGVQTAVCNALFVGFIIAILSSSLIFLQPEKVLSIVLKDGAPALEYAKPYLLIRGFAFLPSLISVTGFSALRGVLDTVTPLKISLFANIFNAVLDPILIFKAGMGVTGAALATLAAEVISAVTFMVVLLNKGLIRWSKLLRLPDMDLLVPLLKGGAALQLRNFALNLTFIAVTRVTQSIDSTGVSAAAHALAIQTFQIGGIFLLALSTVAQILIPREMIEQVDKETGKKSGGLIATKAVANRMMSWGFIMGIVLGALQIALLPLLQKTTPLPEVRKAALVPSYLASLYQTINGLVFIGEGIMVGCGNFLQLSISTSIATAATLLALNILPYKYGLTGVWMSFGVFNTLRLAGVYLHQTRLGPLARRNINKKQKM